MRFNDSEVDFAYGYDVLKRLDERIYTTPGNFTISGTYTYQAIQTLATTRVETYTSTVAETTKVYTYTYDDAGNVVKISCGGVETRYTYDRMNRLLREDNEARSRTYVYTYDTSGNITSKKEYNLTAANVTPTNPIKTISYGYTDQYNGNLMTSYNGTNVGYDENGNITYYMDQYGANIHCTWEGNALKTHSYDHEVVTYTYNADGRMTARNSYGSTITYFYYSGDRLIAEEDVDGRMTVYLYDPVGTPIGMKIRNATDAEGVFTHYWFETNVFGDVVALYNSSGVLLCSYVYDAWGNVRVVQSQSDIGNYANHILYRGYYLDRYTGLYYAGARWYDPAIGRWLSPDPLLYQGQFDANAGFDGYNLYMYCANNPVSNYDPTGNFILTALIVGVVAGAVIGGTIGGTVAYNSAKSSGLEGSDLFWATVGGVGKGALIGGVAGGLAGATAGVAIEYGLASTAATAMITATATITAKATEVTALQAKKSINDGDNGWQIVNDCIGSIFSNGGKIISPAFTKVGTTYATYVATDLIKHKVVPLGFDDFLRSPRGKALSYGLAAYAWIHAAYSIFSTDAIARANQRGYCLR